MKQSNRSKRKLMQSSQKPSVKNTQLTEWLHVIRVASGQKLNVSSAVTLFQEITQQLVTMKTIYGPNVSVAMYGGEGGMMSLLINSLKSSDLKGSKRYSKRVEARTN